MKVLVVASNDINSSYGGGQVYTRNLVDELVKQGIKVSVAFPFSREERPKKSEKDIDCFGFTTTLTISDAIKILQVSNPDIVHAHGYKSIFSVASKELNIPCLVTVHHGGIYCSSGALLNFKEKICTVKCTPEDCLPCVLSNTKAGSFFYPFLKTIPLSIRLFLGEIFEKLPFIYFLTPILLSSINIKRKLDEWESLCNNASLFIAPSVSISKSIIENGASPEKVVVIPHGIPLPDPEVFEKRGKHRKEKIVRFFYLGRINYVKGVHVMLSAFNKIQTNSELHILGGAGNKKEELYMQKLKKKYLNNKRIIWYGKVDEPYKLISDFDVLIHPTICHEVFGLNISEALALGKPVITTKCGGPEMMIKDGENGWFVEPNDPVTLRNAIEKSIKSQDLLFDIKGATSMKEHCMNLINIYEKITY
jgi:glycosyltransferase involved in cell wall biosynthesis